MDSSLVRKMEKAKDYAMQEGARFAYAIAGDLPSDNSDHELTYEAGKWSCNCLYFASRGECTHTMAMQLIDEQHGEGSHQQLA